MLSALNVIMTREIDDQTLRFEKVYCSEVLSQSAVAFASFWSSRFMAHQPVVCSVGPSVLATVVITQEECGMASPPASKLKCIIILF